MIARLALTGLLVATLSTSVLSIPARAAGNDAKLRAALKADLNDYLTKRAKVEMISALSLAVSLPGGADTINVTAGRTKIGGVIPVSPGNLYQIGSNTKAFTAVTLLQLEAEGKLNIEQKVGRFLPQYPAWKNITIHRLLDMTSDIPTYDDVPKMLEAYAANPTKNWSTASLIAYVYPRLKPNAGWLYSNTAYLLSQLIIEKVTGNSYRDELKRRFFDNPSLGLKSTYYEPHLYQFDISRRLVSGYFDSRDPDNAGLAAILGHDVKSYSLSWAQGAGGIVSTPEDVTRWSRALYEGPLLAPKQRRELTTVVSQATGKPAAPATKDNPKTFGLGVGELFVPGMGRFWFYEGETLGYRMTYAYLPESRVVFAVGINSQPTKKEDHVGVLMQAIVSSLRAAGKL